MFNNGPISNADTILELHLSFNWLFQLQLFAHIMQNKQPINAKQILFKFFFVHYTWVSLPFILGARFLCVCAVFFFFSSKIWCVDDQLNHNVNKNEWEKIFKMCKQWAQTKSGHNALKINKKKICLWVITALHVFTFIFVVAVGIQKREEWTHTAKSECQTLKRL